MDGIAGYRSPALRLEQFLDTVGDESGDISAKGNYATATDIFIQPPSSQAYEIARLHVFIQSAGVIASGKYGDIAALTNGIKVIIEHDGNEILLNKAAVKTHDDWAGLCHDSVALNYGATAGKAIAIRWSFWKSDANIWLNGSTLDKLIMRLEDNLSTLVFHRFFVEGRKHSNA